MHYSTLVLLAPLLTVVAQSDLAETPQPLSVEEVRSAIEQLGNDRFDIRQRATERLWRAGATAEPLLEQAAQSRDAEVRLRARRVLERFRFGIFADTPAEVSRRIEQFRMGDFAAKEEALRQLAESGAVRAVLRLLTLEPDERLENKVRPPLIAQLRRQESPAQLLAFWEEAPTEELRGDVLDVLLDRYEEEHAAQAIVELGRDHPNEQLRTAVRSWVEKKLTRLIPASLVAGDWDTSRALVELGAVDDLGMRHLAAFELLTGNLDKRIARLERRIEEAPQSDPVELRQLAYLLRAGGDGAAAAAVAERLGDEGLELQRMILFESRNWQASLALETARQADGGDVPRSDQVERLGFIAAFQRLLGDEAAFQATVQTLARLGGRDALLHASAAEALLINGATAEGLKLKVSDNPNDAFRMMCRQYRYADAFRLVGLGPDAHSRKRWFEQTAEDVRTHAHGSHERLEMALYAVRTLNQLGHRDEAESTFRLLGEAVRSDGFTTRVRSLCEAEMHSAMPDLALEHATIIVDKDPTILGVILPGDDATAMVLWEYFREQDGNLPRVETLHRIRSLLPRQTGTGEPPVDLVALVADIERQNAEASQQDRVKWFLAAGRTCARWGRRDLARQCYEAAAMDSAEAALLLGDELAAGEDWASAAHWYRTAWEMDNQQLAALYLQGRMLERLGRIDEARRLTQTAVLLPLADSQLRADGLARPLAERGQRDAANDQWRLVLAHGTWSEKHVLDAASELGRTIQRDDPLEATELWQQIVLSCLGRFRFTQADAYIHMPHLIKKTRAERWLAEGQDGPAVAAGQRAHAICPGDGELVEQTVPVMERQGMREQANEMFATTFAIMEKSCSMFPESARCRNDLAWMAARCNRRLDDALQYAQAALALAPDTASYLDTLGEVHFRRGEIQQAIECAERCRELEPDNDFYRQQADRFQQALNET